MACQRALPNRLDIKMSESLVAPVVQLGEQLSAVAEKSVGILSVHDMNFVSLMDLRWPGID